MNYLCALELQYCFKGFFWYLSNNNINEVVKKYRLSSILQSDMDSKDQELVFLGCSLVPALVWA
jgi:hypothetical protein